MSLKRIILSLAAATVFVLPDAGQAAVSPQCAALERELANHMASRSGNSRGVARLDQAIARQQEALNATTRQSQELGCARRGFLIFQPRRPTQCLLVESEMSRMQDNLADLNRQRDDMLGRGRRDPVQDRLQQSLARYQCGPQYRRFAPRSSARYRLFEGPSGGIPRQPLNALEGRRLLGDITSYRTLCVRLCDGFYFPISFATLPSRFGDDAGTCSSMSPLSDVQLYVHPNPGGTIEQMTTVDGEPYDNLENAWRFRNEVVQGCSNNSTTLQLEALLESQAAREVEDSLVSGDLDADGGVVATVQVVLNDQTVIPGELPLRDLDRTNTTPASESAASKSDHEPAGEVVKAHINSRYAIRADDRRKDFSQLASGSGTKIVVEIDRNAAATPSNDPSG